MKTEKIAELCHEVNRAYCQSIGDNSQHSWDESPEWQKKSAINGVTFHMKNETTPEDSHKNWMKDKIAEGWVYGEVKDPDKKTHPCLVEYELLPQEQRSKDYIFKAICDFFKKETLRQEMVVNVAEVNSIDELADAIGKRLKENMKDLKYKI